MFTAQRMSLLLTLSYFVHEPITHKREIYCPINSIRVLCQGFCVHFMAPLVEVHGTICTRLLQHGGNCDECLVQSVQLNRNIQQNISSAGRSEVCAVASARWRTLSSREVKRESRWKKRVLHQSLRMNKCHPFNSWFKAKSLKPVEVARIEPRGFYGPQISRSLSTWPWTRHARRRRSVEWPLTRCVRFHFIALAVS